MASLFAYLRYRDALSDGEAQCRAHRAPKRKNPRGCRGSPSGASRTRTGDLLGAIQALFQLSYSPEDPEG